MPRINLLASISKLLSIEKKKGSSLKSQSLTNTCFCLCGQEWQVDSLCN